jgi:hypothetical protein
MNSLSAYEFNQRFPVGTVVDYTPIIGGQERHRTRTRSSAWALGHGGVVVMVEGFIGGVAIEALALPECSGEAMT